MSAVTIVVDAMIKCGNMDRAAIAATIRQIMSQISGNEALRGIVEQWASVIEMGGKIGPPSAH